MSSEQDRLSAGTTQFLSGLSSLQVVTAAIAAQLVPLFLAWKIATPAATALAFLLTLAIIGGAYYFWRRAQGRRAALATRENRFREWANRPLQAAFRGLYSYTRQDELPGTRRRQLAKRIATQVAHPTFVYGVVSGEVGAGKSSLLDSGVARELENGGFSVVLVRGLQGCADVETPQAFFEIIKRRLGQCAAEPVLIFDQFEEALIAWPSIESRHEIGGFLRKPLGDTPVRVVCGLRADYILALHDLSADLPDPTSSKTLFPVKNLDEEEAAQIILECAGRDGFAFDEAFARGLAADLSRDGRVRPPELQLVCVALEASEPERSYRLKGGSEGILSAYIEEAVASASAPDVTRLALRALCNFAALPPAKTQPKTIEEISHLIPSGSDFSRLEDVLRQLSEAGLLAIMVRNDQKTYALVHDYLVQPIAIATSDASTETERATQMLRLHLAEYSADTKSRIPRRRLRWIRSHADRELLSSPSAQNLMRLSARAARVRITFVATAIIVLAVLVAGSLLLAAYNAYQNAIQEDFQNSQDELEARQNRARPDIIKRENETRSLIVGVIRREISRDQTISAVARMRLYVLLDEAERFSQSHESRQGR